MSWTIRAARPGDHDAILSLVDAAFTDETRDGHEEVAIVVDTWAADAAPDGLDLVAVEGDEVLGHVLAARADLDGREILAVAPLAVARPRQSEGVGTALMGEVIRRAEAAHWPLVALLGRPEYYGRFGFEPSGPLGISYPPVGADNPHFQVLRLPGYDPAYRGAVTYCWEAKKSPA